ncbi:MAG: class I SAM-dependent methyltransferase [Bacteroidota bacterium]
MTTNFEEYSAEDFYDSLFEDYHLIFADWDRSIARQAAVLDRLIGTYADRKVEKLWDCTCGIGTQALGLAAKGYQILGTDLSAKAVARAKREAKQRALSATFATADLRVSEQLPQSLFDVILSCDNSLPHLLQTEELLLALINIKDRLKDNGLFIGSMRDYDQIVLEQPSSTSPSRKMVGKEEIISFQTWDWEADPIYQIKHFVIKGKGDEYQTKVRRATYRAYQREEMGEAFRAAGFKKISWLFPNETGYYQPIFVITT